MEGRGEGRKGSSVEGRGGRSRLACVGVHAWDCNSQGEGGAMR